MRKDIFTEDSPFKTVEDFTAWWLERKGVTLPELAEASYYNRHISLDRVANKAIDYTDILLQDIDEHNLWDYDAVDAEQYLVMGQVITYGYHSHIYLQGWSGKLKEVEGKSQQRQDAWLANLD